MAGHRKWSDLKAAKQLRQVLHALPHHDPRFEPWIDEDPGYLPFLEITRELQPLKVLEIGALSGYSMVAMLEGCPGIKIMTWVDDEQYYRGSNTDAKLNLQSYLARVGRPHGTLLSWYYRCWGLVGLLTRFDLVHIDGDHSTLGKLRDLIVTHELINPRWILVDDTRKRDVFMGLDKFLTSVPGAYDYRTVEETRGLVLLTRKEP